MMASVPDEGVRQDPPMPLAGRLPMLAALVVALSTPAAPAAPPTPPAPAQPVPATASLTIETAVFATAFAGGGACLRRPDAVFQPAEQALICVTLADFGARPITTGVRVEFQVGVQIRAAETGAVLARSNEFDNLVRDSTTAPMRHFDVVRANLPSLRPGDYVLRLTIRDVYTGRIGAADLPFSVMPRP